MLGHPLDPARPPARQHRAEVGFVFQEFALVERATVRQNVLNGRLGRTGPFASLFGRFTPADHAAAEAAMEETGIAELAEKRADQLSGGQRQRVAISRCLAQDPQLILADEPVSNLDPVRAEAVLRLLAATAERRGATFVFWSHQPALATRFARRVIALRDGRIAFDGAPSALTAEELAAIYEDVYEGGVPAAASLRLADERAVAYVPARSVLGCPLAEPPRRRRDSLGRRDDRCRAGTAGRCRRPHRRVPRAHGAARPLRHAGGRQGHGRDPQDRRPRHARLHHGLARAGGRSRPRR